MTIRMALKHIRELAPETEKTFQTIRQNRYCHPLRDCGIFRCPVTTRDTSAVQ